MTGATTANGPRVAARLLAAVAALGAGAGGVIVVAALLRSTPGPVSTAATVAGSAAPAPAEAKPPPTFPAPPPGATVFMHQDGATVLALAATPGSRRLALQASAVDPEGVGTSGLGVRFSVGDAHAAAVACGPGCYRATIPVASRPQAVDVAVKGRGLDTTWRVALPAVWPAPAAASIVARATRAWRSLRSVAYTEHLASAPGDAVTSTWRTAAPSSAAYAIPHSYSSVVIGARRWDKAPGGRWVASEQNPPLTEPIPFWVKATNAHLLGSATVGGHRVSIVSFYDPTIPAWFRATIETATLRTVRLQMMATAHFMDDRYGSFNDAARIVPPAR